MNFFAHAVAARRVSDEPRFLLGAMLPDLGSMCGVYPQAIGCSTVEAGVAHHHRTDAVFHGAPSFVRLLSSTSAALRGEGVPRGGALGAAHVGIELLLDGVLADRAEDCRAYAQAIAGAAGQETTRFTFGAAGDDDRWRNLCARLASGEFPGAYRDPAFVADRVIGILGRRPRLALDAAAAAAVRRVLPTLQAAVACAAPALLGGG